MKIAIAQIQSTRGDIVENIEKHRMYVKMASTSQADAIFFPELSLTAYEPKLAKDLAMDQDNSRLDVFQELSQEENITIGLGLPSKSESGIHIAMVIFQPDRPRRSYAKQQLHSDELAYFVEARQHLIFTVDQIKIAPAICYESLQWNHAQEANRLGAELYLASVAKSLKGVDKAFAHFPQVAKKFSIPVLMVNSIGFCDNFMAAGQSSAWTKTGQLVGQLDSKLEGIIIFDTETERVSKPTME